ncbi:MAG: hypothetical protein JWP14_727 [Frankiales bacterium]|nr:hypothetical protein [Frankiales bacterium]
MSDSGLVVPGTLGTATIHNRMPSNGGLDDQVFNRLLKERIIFLGSAVED